MLLQFDFHARKPGRPGGAPLLASQVWRRTHSHSVIALEWDGAEIMQPVCHSRRTGSVIRKRAGALWIKNASEQIALPHKKRYTQNINTARRKMFTQ